LLARRKEALLASAAQLAAERADGEREGYLLASLSPLQAASFRRAEVRVAAELAWHEECEKFLGLPADRGASAVGTSRRRADKGTSG
jgi:hypothetical protein